LFFDSHLVLEAELVAIVGQTKTFADPPGLYSGLGGGKFHQGVRCGDLIHVAGQVALDREGAVLHRGDMPAQTRVVMERINQVLRDLGASLGDLVSMRTYFVGHEGWEEAVKVRAEYLSDGPTNTSVRTSSLVVPELLVQIEAVAIVGASKEFIDPPDHHAAVEAPFHHGVRCGNMIFVGGQGPFDSNGDVVNPGDIVGQTPTAMDNLKRVVDALGGSMDDVVQYHTYYIGREDLQATIPIRSSYFKQGKGPVTRGVVADGLGRAGVAIAFEAVAIVDD
jgi:enamine deaminase RidA (YjgF/YER057c/UK114 family)